MKYLVLIFVMASLFNGCVQKGIEVDKKLGVTSSGTTSTSNLSKLIFTGVNSVVNGDCSLIVLSTVDKDGATLLMTSDLSVNLTVSGSGSFYSDSGCASPITSTTVLTGNSDSSIFFSPSALGSAIVTARASSYVQATMAIASTSAPITSTPAPTKLKVNGSQNILTNVCSPLTINLLDQSGNDFNALSNTTVNMSGVSSLYSDSACTSSITSTTIASGTSSKSIYVKTAAAGAYIVPFTSAGLVTDNFPLLAVAQASNTVSEQALQILGTTQFYSGQCMPFIVNVIGSNGAPMLATSSKTITLSGTVVGNLYSDSSCSSNLATLSSLSVASGSSNTVFYYKSASGTNLILNASSAGLVPGSLSISVVPATVATTLVATKVKLSGSQNTQKNLCSPLSVMILDQQNNAFNVSSNTTVNLSGISSFYSDSGCSSSATSVTVSSGTSSSLVYFKSGTSGGFVAQATSAGLNADNFPVVVIDPPAVASVVESALQIQAPSQFATNVCAPININLLGSNGLPIISTSTRTVTLSGTVLGNLYSDSGCSSNLASLSSLAISSGNTGTLVYFKSSSALSVVLSATTPSMTAASYSFIVTNNSVTPTAYSLAVVGANSSIVNDCVPMSAKVMNTVNLAMAVASNTTVNFSASSANLKVYSDPTCSSLTSSLVMNSGDTYLDFYVKGIATGPFMLTLQSSGLINANQPVQVNSGSTTAAAYKLYISSVAQATQDVCTPVSIASLDYNGNMINVSSSTTVNLSATGDITYYTTSACSTTTTTTTIANGTSLKTLYYKANSGTSAILLAQASGLVDSYFTLSILLPSGATGSPVQLKYVGSIGAYTDACYQYQVQSVDENGIARNVSADKTITLGGVGSGAFYSDSGCTATITTTTILNGTNTKTIYFQDSTIEALLFTASTTGLASTSFSVNVTANPESLGGLKLEGQQNLYTTSCYPYVVTALKNSGGVKSVTADVNLTLSSSANYAWYTNSSCSTSASTPKVLSGQSTATYYLKVTTAGNYILSASAASINAGNLAVAVGTNVTDVAINFEDTSFSVTEAVGLVKLKVNLTSPATSTISIPYTVGGTASKPSDHNLSSGNVVINAGQSSGQISFYVYDDAVVESNETITVALGTSPAGYYLGTKNNLTITIVDNDSNNTSIASNTIPKFISIANGGNHTCAVTSTGGVKCWGYNAYGQLGNNSTANSVVPVDVYGISSGAVKVVAGQYHTCVLMSDTTVKCWGYNAYGQLGEYSNTNRSIPYAVVNSSNATVTGFSDVTAGSAHSCGIVSGAVRCWGAGNSYQNGSNGSHYNYTYPLAVLTSGVISVSAGYTHTCALKSDTTVYCWGVNNYGEMGSMGNNWNPTQISNLNASIVVAGGLHTCALLTNGSVKCFGYNVNGQLGDGTTSNRNTPTYVSGIASGVVNLSLSMYSTCVYYSSGSVQCFGSNGYGTLGNSSYIDSVTPQNVIGLGDASIASTGSQASHMCAITTRSKIKCWGYNAYYQLGDGTTNSSSRIVEVNFDGILPISNATKIVTSSDHTCTLTSVGKLYCVGSNSNGQLGGGNLLTTTLPISERGIGLTFTDFDLVKSLNPGSTCGVLNTGAIKCWGANSYGQLGNGTTTDSSTPVTVSGGFTFSKVTMGLGYGCGLTTSGGVKCWGNNNYGQLGNNTTTNSSTPVDVTGLSSGVTYINAGYYHTCAVQSGALKCWGYNGNYQLGDGTATNRLTPVTIIASGITQVSASYHHTCSLDSSGGIKCWGTNYGGAWSYGCGVTSTSTQYQTSTPAVIAASGYSAISTAYSVFYNPGASTTTGFSQTCGISGTSVKCWGYNHNNGNGLLNMGSNTSVCSQATVTSLANATSISMSENASIAGSFTGCVIIGGVPQCWGTNTYGQLGNNTLNDSITSLVPVYSRSKASDTMTRIFSGYKHSCLVNNYSTYCWGDNTYGQLGTGNTTSQTTATLSNFDVLVDKISLGQDHTCLLSREGNIFCVGKNDRGQLGDGTNTNSTSIKWISAGNSILSSGYNFNCAYNTNNIATYCWGANDSGQLGDGTTTDRNTPTLVSTAKNFSQGLFAGPTSICANATSGGTYCWGDNANQQLGFGNGGASFYTSPNALGFQFDSVSVGNSHSCGIKQNNSFIPSIYCTGQNTYGELGLTGLDQPSYSAVTNVPSDLTYPTSIQVGDNHSCALDGISNKVFCWGSNSKGQLGQSRIGYSYSPTYIPGSDNTLSISLAGNLTCFVQLTSASATSLRPPMCSGLNDYGQLGNGTTSDSFIPQYVLGAP